MKELLILALGVAVAFLCYDTSHQRAVAATLATQRDEAVAQQKDLVQERDSARAEVNRLLATMQKPSQAWLQQRLVERPATLEAPSYNHTAPLPPITGTNSATPAYTTATGNSSRVYLQDSTGRFWVDVAGAKHYE